MIDLDNIEKLGYGLNHTGKSQTERDDTRLNISAGWYQSTRGSLYYYDGVIWDEVPEWDIKTLEYLG